CVSGGGIQYSLDSW
nr:immunoglobulin heavy chain junction region [Macaca mulatta]MOV55975.1 immunoglobulin heavy chain junction region [Macaca mulatta]MOV56014.1 immunoglobulin heavy chain junction region [Macaca mulatta]MOV56120.1 immunoglobulin heavy chain junction region [Macaca mulatta]MOV56761.1 immunoglobulin heavy chain junction region [Macaca mulatta]